MSGQIIITLILGGIASFIAGLNFYYNWRLAKDKMNKELFTEFNNRHDKLNDSLNEIVETCKTIEELKEQPFLNNKLNDYFNLCAEEYYWKKKKRIDDTIWNSWHYGMNSWYNNYDIIRLAWNDEIKRNGCRSYYIEKADEFFSIKLNITT